MLTLLQHIAVSSPSCKYQSRPIPISAERLLTYLFPRKEWDDIHKMESPNTLQLSDRPTGTHNLFDNTTMNSSWIEKENGDMEANFATYHRVINNVTLAMPHPGVYMAATDPINGILQPSELLGLGQYSIRASVVAPVVNVMCVNMNESEVAPLVYQRWPNARTNNNSFTNDLPPDWEVDVPGASETEWLNSTVVDDIFKWGEKYGREPPVFPLVRSPHFLSISHVNKCRQSRNQRFAPGIENVLC